MNRTVKRLLRSFYILCMLLLVALMIYPLLYSALGGFNHDEDFKSTTTMLPLPKHWTFLNYKYGLTAGALRALINTFLRTFWYTGIALIIAVLVGYVLARYEFPGKRFFMSFIVVLRVIPGVLMMIPTFVMVSRIPLVGGNDIWGNGGHGLYNNMLILFIHLGSGYLLDALLFRQAMLSLPPAFEESAELDGASFLQILIRVVIPMQKPILSVIAIGTALSTWNDWMTPFLYINDSSRSTLPAYIASLTSTLNNFKDNPQYAKIFALATLATIPPLVLFLLLQKYIVQGIASAGVKE